MTDTDIRPATRSELIAAVGATCVRRGHWTACGHDIRRLHVSLTRDGIRRPLWGVDTPRSWLQPVGETFDSFDAALAHVADLEGKAPRP